MVFNDLDKWMLDIELKLNPTRREKRQHLKLEQIRDRLYEKYKSKLQAQPGVSQIVYLKLCRERSMTPVERAINNMWDTLKTIGLVPEVRNERRS